MVDRRSYLDELRRRVLVFDGAMGTSIQALELSAVIVSGLLLVWASARWSPGRAAALAVGVALALPAGDVTVEEMRGLAGLAERYGNGTLRTTNDQNLVLPPETLARNKRNVLEFYDLAFNKGRPREAIDKFYADTGRYPDSLDVLVTRRYLRSQTEPRA